MCEKMDKMKVDLVEQWGLLKMRVALLEENKITPPDIKYLYAYLEGDKLEKKENLERIGVLFAHVMDRNQEALEAMKNNLGEDYDPQARDTHDRVRLKGSD